VLVKSATADRLSAALCEADFDTLRCERVIRQKIANSGNFDSVALLETSRSLARDGVLGDRRITRFNDDLTVDEVGGLFILNSE